MMKNNKKGFTLVELIAVIAILSILLIMALPQLLDSYNDTKERAFIAQVQAIYKAAEKKYISDQFTPDSVSNNATYCHDNAEEQNDLDLSSDDVLYKIQFTNGKITSIIVSDGTYLYTSPSIGDGDYFKVADIVFNDTDVTDATDSSITCN